MLPGAGMTVAQTFVGVMLFWGVKRLFCSDQDDTEAPESTAELFSQWFCAFSVYWEFEDGGQHFLDFRKPFTMKEEEKTRGLR